MLAIRYGIIYSFLQVHNFEFQLSDINFFLLVLSTVLIAAGGYVINDYFDRRIDMTNKPDKVVVGVHIERRKVMSLHNLLTALGLAIGFYLSFSVGQSSFAFVFIAISGALWFYSTLYKRQLLVGNILIAVLTALVPLIVVLYDVPKILKYYRLVFEQNYNLYIDMQYMMYAVLMFSGFAFVSTFVREIIKDMEDMEGDSTCERRTVPIVWGIPFAKGISIFFILVTVFSLWFIYYIFLQSDILSLVYVILVLTAPLMSLIYFVLKAKTPKDYHFCSQFLKIIMLLGLLYVIPFYLSVAQIS